jgi:phosphatidate cytidylyltransferase
MLKHRIFSAILMTAFFGGLTVLDGWFDGSATASMVDDKPVQGTLLAILLAVVLVLAVVEFARLVASKGLTVFVPVCVGGVVLVSTTWYWPQWFPIEPHLYLMLVVAFFLMAALWQQCRCQGTMGVLGNCGVNCLAIAYLGVLGAFILAIRVEMGLWEVLMVVCVVKCSDIGAYTLGKLFGKHKFSPRVSPGKTWEGLAGAMAFAAVVSLAFSAAFATMVWWKALAFGPAFAVIGQMGDLAESMMKRDAQQKDASNRVPGFGGILDVIDSPLVAAPFGYLFFRFVV